MRHIVKYILIKDIVEGSRGSDVFDNRKFEVVPVRAEFLPKEVGPEVDRIAPTIV